MKIFEIIGLKRTNKDFINKIASTKDNKNVDVLAEKLKQLKIFSNVMVKKQQILVTENKNSISLKFNGETPAFNVKLWNIFGRGVNFNADISDMKRYTIELVKPFVGKNILFLSAVSSKSTVNHPLFNYIKGINEVSLKNQNFSLGLGSEKVNNYHQSYLRGTLNFKNIILDIKNVFWDTSYTKAELKVDIDIPLTNKIKGTMAFGLGSLIGNFPDFERFYLGKNIKGYKDMSVSPIDANIPTGGASYIEITNKLAYNIMNLDFYIFGSAGYNSRGSNIKEAVENMITSLKLKNTSCPGLSVGSGISIPMSKVGGTSLDLSLSVPLTDNKDFKKYEFDFNIDF